MRVKILNTDERLGVKAGEIYAAQRYWLDPTEKITLLKREPDGYDPCCNQYAHEVLHDIGGRWHRLEGSRFVEVEDDSDDA